MNFIDRTYHLIGGANIDISGKSLSPLRFHDSNPGRISVSFGGVARNIANTLVNLGRRVRFLTAFGDDPLGLQCLDECRRLKMDVSDCIVVPRASSSTYLAVLSDNGDMGCAVSDMSILKNLDHDHIFDFLKKTQKSDILAVDTNLDEATIDFIVSNSDCLLVSDPISTVKSEKLKPHLSRLCVFKPNRMEAEVLSGLKICDESSLLKAAQFFRMQGVKDILITLGEQGGLMGCDEGFFRYTHKKANIVNATGAGDAFMAAYIAYLEEGPFESLKFAIAASIATCMCERTVEDKINHEYLLTIKSNFAIDIKEVKN
jgi:pseudouridine kinase